MNCNAFHGVLTVEQSNERVREIEIKYIAQLNEATRSAEERLEKQVRCLCKDLGIVSHYQLFFNVLRCAIFEGCVRTSL